MRQAPRRILGAAVLAAALPAFGFAQAPDRLNDLEKRIEALTQEVERMKLGEAADPVADARAQGFAPAASKVYQARNQRVSIGGYGEMVYQGFSRRNQKGDRAAKRNEADFVRAILYAGYKFNDWILFNSELEFEHGSTGKGRGEVSVEQAYLDFRLKDWLGVRAGTVLIPVGIVNETHEPTTFHGARRPSVETNILPTTWRENGAGLFGTVGPVSYRTYLTSGLQATTNTGVTGFRGSDALRNGRSSGAKSYAEDLAWSARVDVEPAAGALAGASLYAGEADQKFTAAAVPVTVWDLHARGEWRGAEFKALYAQGRVGNPDSVNTANSVAPGATTGVGGEFFGGYLEGAFNVLSLCPKGTTHYLAPFARWERYDTQQKVPDGWRNDAANSRVEYTVGLTYKPVSQVAVKLDHQWLLNQARTGVNQFNLGVGYIF